MPPLIYVAHRPGPFTALVQASEIGGLRLTAMPPVRIQDRFYDTANGDLLQQGLALRVRDLDGQWSLSLRSASGKEPGRFADEPLPPAGVPDGPLELPDGQISEAVRFAVGGETLVPLLTVRRYRTPRVARRDDRPIGTVAFDVTVYDVIGGRVVANEVQIDADQSEGLADALDSDLRASGLEPVSDSAFERGILRTRRTLSETVLLLPRERDALEAAVDRSHPRSVAAQVVLLDSRRFRPDTIASRTGIGMARVRKIRERFREVRLGVLDAQTPPLARRGPSAPARPRPAAPTPDLPRPFESGDGSALTTARNASSLAELIDQFRVDRVETPILDDVEPADDVSAPAASPPAFSRRRYPVILGPVAHGTFASRVPAAFTDVDLAAVVAPRVRDVTARQPSHRSIQLDTISGDTFLLTAAHTTLRQRLDTFDEAARAFIASRAPSDARTVQQAAHGIRMAVETFRAVLPGPSAQRLVQGLRPLVTDLDAALDYGRAALGAARDAGDVPVPLAQRSAWTLDTAATTLGEEIDGEWGASAQRMMRQIESETSSGRYRSDESPSPFDDFVGSPLRGTVPVRFRHILGSELWRRFEVVRSFEDSLRPPTPEVARRLAVALAGLQFIVDLASQAIVGADDALHRVADAVRVAERAVTQARQQAVTVAIQGGTPPADTLDIVAGVWDAIVAPSFRQRLASVVVAV
ncbi:MAG: CYTH domain-containing protein [Bacteroidota bacterium]